MFKVALAFALLLLPVYGADISGRWPASITGGGRVIPLHFEFRQQPGQLLGAVGQRADFLAPLGQLRFDGTMLSFQFQIPMGPTFQFQGVVEGDTASGPLTTTPAGPTAKLEMKRVGAAWRLPPANGPADVAGMSDEFDNPATLKNWRTLSDAEGLPNRIEKADVSAGHLSVLPQSGAWWAGYHGVYFFKEVKGGFVITTRVKVTGKSGGEPAQIWTISGLLVRAPGNLENWIYVMTGRGPRSERVIDAKSTLNNDNAWDITPAQPGWYDLRLVRIGPLFIAMCRPDGGEWTVRKRIVREDLPATLQAGINVTSDFKLSSTMPFAKYNAELFPSSSPDSLTTFDFVRFSRPAPASQLAGRELIAISDAELLALFR